MNMLVEASHSVSKTGHLLISGCDTVLLARKHKTPLYIIDENLIRNKCREYNEALKKFYPGPFLAVYAGKANLNLALCQIMKQENMGMDVSSGGDIYTAAKAGFPAAKMVFHGNNKSAEELFLALKTGVGRIVVDNACELLTLNELCLKHKKRMDILLRITPGIKPKTHSYISTGQLDTKFGIPVKEAIHCARQASRLKGVVLQGFHCHIGSQIFNLNSFEASIKVMLKFMKAFRRKTRVTVGEMNLGGGLGIRYVEKDKPPAIERFIQVISTVIQKTCRELRFPLPRLLLEPGRSIIGEAGTTLYTVGSVKKIQGIRTYVAVDGGMADNPRPALYGSVYESVLANRVNGAPSEKVSVAGKCCETGDMLLWDVKLPKPHPGDLIAVLCTGAYNASMASNYNRLPRPATVLVKNGKARLIVKREKYQDLIKNEIKLP